MEDNPNFTFHLVARDLKIFLIHQHFKFPFQEGSTRTFKFIQDWNRDNHLVICILGANKSDVERMKTHFNSQNDRNISFLQHQEKLFLYKDEKGNNFYILQNDYSQNMNPPQRIQSFLGFSMEVRRVFTKYIRSENSKIDFVYATSTPLTVLIPALWIKRRFKIPFTFEVRDLWPEVPIALGFLKNPVMQYLAKRLANQGYKKAKEIVVASPDMGDYIVRHYNVAFEKLRVVENSSSDEFKHLVTPNFNTTHFRVVYFGAVGYANGLESFLALAEYVQENMEHSPYPTWSFDFMIIGGGSELGKLKEMANYLKLKNLTFLDSVPKNELPKIIDGIQISYIGFRNVEILSTSSPNKFFDSLEMGMIPLINFKGWIHKRGLALGEDWYLDPEHPEDFFRVVGKLIEKRQSIKVVG